MKTRLFIALFILNMNAALAQSSSESLEAFSHTLSKIAEESSRAKILKFQTLADKSSALAKRLAFSPTVSARVSQPINEWSDTQNENSGSISAQLNIFKFGGSFADYMQGQKISEKADTQLATNLIEIEIQAAKVIFGWILLRRKVDNLKAILKLKRDFLLVAQERFLRGELAAQEVDKVRIDSYNSEIDVNNAENELLAIKAEVDIYMPAARSITEWPWLGLDINIKPKPVDERHEFKIHQLSSEIAKYSSWQLHTNWLPQISLEANYHTLSTSTFSPGEWSVLGVLSFPIWDGGAHLSQIRSQKQIIEKSLSTLEDFKNTAQAQNTVLEDRILNAKRNLQISLRSSQIAQELAKYNIRRFRLGRATVNDLLVEQSRQFGSENLAQESLRSYHLVLMDLCRSADLRPSQCFKN